MFGGEADGQGGIALTTNIKEDTSPIPLSHAYAISNLKKINHPLVEYPVGIQ